MKCFIELCLYPEPFPPQDFLFSDIHDLGGLFLANYTDSPAMATLFGLDHASVLRGETSLVVLADGTDNIRALHPGKTLADALTILSQHPDLADLSALFPK
jgi:hypothetical protein